MKYLEYHDKVKMRPYINYNIENFTPGMLQLQDYFQKKWQEHLSEWGHSIGLHVLLYSVKKILKFAVPEY